MKSLSLDDSYDLRFRPAAGTTSYYRQDEIFRMLDPQGVPSQIEHYQTHFARRVDDPNPVGVRETVTWEGVRRRVNNEAPESLPWMAGYTYEFCAEDSYEDFHWKIDNFPSDLLGFMVLQVMVTAHFEYDYLRSESHGSIESLRRIGDRVQPGDNDQPFRIALPGWGEVPAFTKRHVVTSFDGLTSVNGHPCALLTFYVEASPFQTIYGDTTLDMSSSFRGTLRPRLSDGVLEYGEILEWVFVRDAFATNPVHQIRRLSAEEYQSEISREWVDDVNPLSPNL